METICQGCGQPILRGGEVVRVSYGKLGYTAHPHRRVEERLEADYFHFGCEVAIRTPQENPNAKAEREDRQERALPA